MSLATIWVEQLKRRKLRSWLSRGQRCLTVCEAYKPLLLCPSHLSSTSSQPHLSPLHKYLSSLTPSSSNVFLSFFFSLCRYFRYYHHICCPLTPLISLLSYLWTPVAFSTLLSFLFHLLIYTADICIMSTVHKYMGVCIRIFTTYPLWGMYVFSLISFASYFKSHIFSPLFSLLLFIISTYHLLPLGTNAP